MEAEPDRLHDLLMDLVRVAALLHPDQSIPRHPISLSQAFALHELDTNTPLSQRDLAERLRLEKSTVSRLVADMEHEGLLVRDRDPENRRSYRLRLTDHGRAVHAHLAAAFHHRHVQLLSAITGAERAALLSGLPALIRALRNAGRPTEH